MKILIIDDNEVSINSVKKALKELYTAEAGHSVALITDPEKGVQKANNSYDIIFID